MILQTIAYKFNLLNAHLNDYEFLVKENVKNERIVVKKNQVHDQSICLGGKL